ncbi:MAG TPA: FG-GAP repeat protein [Terriglobales bacterium]
MHKHLAVVLGLALGAGAAVIRVPVATIPGSGGPNGIVLAAQNEILATSCQVCSSANQVQLYAVGTWNLIATLTISDSSVRVSSLAIQNNYIVVTADGGPNGNNGAAYIFTRPTDGWANETSSATLEPSDPEPGCAFGYSAAAWGNTVVIGAPGCADGTGKAYVYIEPAGGWADATENAQLTATDSQGGWEVGGAVAVNGEVGGGGNLIAVGAWGGGVAYLYEEPNSGWASMTQTAEIGAGVPDLFGTTVSLSKQVLAVGVPLYRDSNGIVGAVEIYDEPQTGWVDQASPNYLLSEAQGKDLGAAVNITGRGVLTACCSTSNIKGHPSPRDTAYLWHEDQKWSETIKLSAKGLTATVTTSTSLADWAFVGDEYGNIFIFDGK